MAFFPNSNSDNVQTNRALEDSVWDHLYLYTPEAAQKELALPDPLAKQEGVYIPPEEKAEDNSLGDVFGWSLSDDQQDSDEDDMDDNVFDMDIDDTELPPPLKSDNTNPILCQRHLMQPKFSDLESTPYIPPTSYHPDFNYQNSAFIPEDYTPVKYIDPSSLQLRRNSSFLIQNNLAQDEKLLEASKQKPVPLPAEEIPAVEMDMDINDEVYPLIDDEPVQVQSSTPAPSTPVTHHTTDTPSSTSQDIPALASPESLKLAESDENDDEFEPSDNSVSRKKAAKRKGKTASVSYGTHICNLVFQNGKECKRSFTRPYDLARHQETIHAPVRKTYKCEACGSSSKTFSRHDALSRHMRLKHSS